MQIQELELAHVEAEVKASHRQQRTRWPEATNLETLVSDWLQPEAASLSTKPPWHGCSILACMQAHAVASLPVGRVRHLNQGWAFWVALTLAVIGGFVDAIGYLMLFHLFTAHMSGNTASAGADLGQLEWSNALRSFVPIALFLIGVCVGAFIKREGIRRGLQSWFAVTCALEGLLLVALIVFGEGKNEAALAQNSGQYVFLVALPCLAMGIQSASFQRVGSVGVRTTFVTGILTGLGEELVATIYHVRDRRQDSDTAEISVSAAMTGTLERASLFGGLWFAYLVGGIVAGVALVLWQLESLILPVIALVVLAVVDFVRPTQPSFTPA
jgi:uncharacterized membrane protein YoaK (UPF0700 family)